MLHLRTSILGFALLISMSAFAAAEESGDDLPPPGMVKVEQTDLIPPVPPQRDYELKPYKDRRGKWGMLLGFAYNSYTPSNYLPLFTDPSLPDSKFDDVFGSPQTPLLEGQLTVKRNMSFGSAGIEFGVGYYDNNSQLGTELQLTQLRLGLIVVLDTLFSTPYVAPYASVGAFIINSTESLGNDSTTESTSVAPYFTVGVQFTLDWLDRDSARQAYESGSVQSTFLFAEIRTYLASASDTEPDFGQSIAPGGGLRIEF